MLVPTTSRNKAQPTKSAQIINKKMNTTRILNKIYFSRRQKQLEKYTTQAKQLQLKAFRNLMRKGAKTLWGKEHGYADIESYEQFRNKVHVNTYEELKKYIHKMREGEANVL